MTLTRLQVEHEGFLGGLDVEFKSGLNVVIGARGTGKTSIVELIRFALNVSGFTEDAEERGALQAAAILQGGAASVSFRDGDSVGNVTRSSGGFVVASADSGPRCTILAQNEVEAVGAQPLGRLHLIDRFRTNAAKNDRRMLQLRSELESLTREVRDVVAEGSNLAQQVQELKELEEDLAVARDIQDTLLIQARASNQEREALARLEQSSNDLASRSATVGQTLQEIMGVGEDLSRIRDGSWITIWRGPRFDEDIDLRPARERIGQAFSAIDSASRELGNAQEELERVAAETVERRRAVDEEGRRLRQRLDAVQSGIGLASRRVQEIEERLGQLRAMTERLRDRRQQFRDMASLRDEAYEQLEAVRDTVFGERLAIAESLNDALGPQIRVRVRHSARTESYQAGLIAALRGSGLHYNSLAPHIARAVSPIELANWVERGAIDELATSLQLARERAIALISALRTAGLEAIVASEIEDEAIFELLDGRDYKPTDRLSIGQRCTVVLPILLGQHGDTLIVDQPEDHLDNAFIASTLVAALRNRRPGDQFIFTSHNANIPVLGEADNVIVLNSDGDRGYVAASGELEDPIIVDHINNIMEGGREAFAARSAFYAEHGPVR